MNVIIENQQELAYWVRAQTRRLDMAVAFWGTGAIEALRLKGRRNVRILLDLSAGASNPDVVKALRDAKGISVKQIHRLHAKLYLGESELIIGSANASANGLGVEGKEATHWNELSLKTADESSLAEARAWFNKHWAAGKTVSDQDIESARAKWLARRRNRPVTSTSHIIDVAATRPEELEGRGIMINVSTAEMSDEAAAEIRAREKVEGRELWAYENWPKIPINAVMIAFWAPEKGRIEWDEPKVQLTPSKKRRSKLKYVTETTLGGYDVGRIGDWAPRIRYYRDHPQHGKAWLRDQGVCMDLNRFVEITQPARSAKPRLSMTLHRGFRSG